MTDRVDLSEFDDPWTGLATMIFWQAAYDLTLLGDRDHMIVSQRVVSKKEIAQFFNGGWAETLAHGLGWTIEEMEDFMNRG